MTLNMLKSGLVALLATVSMPALAASEKLSIISNGEVFGYVVGDTQGKKISVDYHVDNNGRGPKHHEDIVLGAGDIPVEWTIKGTSLMGGPVQEHFAWSNGAATWESQADKGSIKATTPGLYIVNDDSPWALGVYARALLAAKKNSMPTLPGGQIGIAKVRDLRVGSVDVGVYRVEGVQLAPAYIMLDKNKRLFATFDATSVAVREGFEAEAPALLKLGAELGGERVRTISAKVTHRFDVPVRIRNVRIFDPKSGKLGGLSTVVTMRDRITQIIPGEENDPIADQVVIDGAGGTLYPGLYDMHSHMTMDKGLFDLAAGVTGTRDMGNDNGFLLQLMPEMESGEVAGPYIVPDGFLEGRSPFSARYGIIPETLEDAIKAVHWYADRGYREIKIYNSFNPEWVRPVAAEAHRFGLGVTGHVPAFDTPDRVINDGYDTIAHINQLMLGWMLDPKEDTRTPLRLTAMSRAADLDLNAPNVQKTVRLMKDKGIALDPTAAIVERLMLSRAGQVGEADVDYLDHMPIGYQRYRKRTFVPLKDAQEDARYGQAFATVLRTIKMLHDAGVQLLPGTDDEVGFTLQRELELYVKAGLTPAEALTIGTLGSAKYLGEDGQRGTIERGKLAEFVLVAGDPTKDIKAIRRPRMVMRAASVYFPSEIYQLLNIAPLASAPTMHVPDKEGVVGNGQHAIMLFGTDAHEHEND